MSKTSGGLRNDNPKVQKAKKVKEAGKSEYTAQDKMVLSVYQGAGYGLINNALRAGEETSATKLMDVAIAKNKIKNDLMVYRGIKDLESVLGGKIDPSKLVGTTITEKSYMSVSTSKSVANSFTDGSKKASAVFKIKVPKGTNFADMDSSTGIKAKEKEYLLKRGLSYKITKVKLVNGRYEIEATIK